VISLLQPNKQGSPPSFSLIVFFLCTDAHPKQPRRRVSDGTAPMYQAAPYKAPSQNQPCNPSSSYSNLVRRRSLSSLPSSPPCSRTSAPLSSQALPSTFPSTLTTLARLRRPRLRVPATTGRYASPCSRTTASRRQDRVLQPCALSGLTSPPPAAFFLRQQAAACPRLRPARQGLRPSTPTCVRVPPPPWMPTRRSYAPPRAHPRTPVASPRLPLRPRQRIRPRTPKIKDMALFFPSGRRQNPAAPALLRPLRARTRTSGEPVLLFPSFPVYFCLLL
jgi:hypothetical protein